MAQEMSTEPTLADLLRIFRTEIFSNLNCHHVGYIDSFDASKQMANVHIAYSRKVEEDTSTHERADYPMLLDVPVIVLGGGSGSLRFPIAPGDTCILLCNDKDLDNFMTGGKGNLLNTDRRHSFSDAVALVGLRSLVDVLSNYSTDRTELVHDETKLSLKDKIKLENAATSLYSVLTDVMTILNTISAAVAVNPGNASFPGLTAVVDSAKAKLDTLME